MDPVSPELLARLPRTFVPALNEQIKNWDVLFPAERRTMSAQMSCSPPAGTRVSRSL
jgi:hypothetical protein